MQVFIFIGNYYIVVWVILQVILSLLKKLKKSIHGLHTKNSNYKYNNKSFNFKAKQ